VDKPKGKQRKEKYLTEDPMSHEKLSRILDMIWKYTNMVVS
jgi:hypothetical protein